ncbi:MAG: 3-deoxy-D-manno-octulosonic acid transferase, partial [Xanthobacteraceae bacterium]
AERLPATLSTYRLLMRAAAPLAPMLLSYRLKRGKEHARRLGERRGETSIPRPSGPLVWLHGASVGEITAVLPLIERIHGRGLNVLVTSGTVTSASVAEKRLPPGVIHQFAPLDTPQFAARFLNHWKPDLGLFVESDLWPSMITTASERGVPLILVNGRLSERSFNRWRVFPRTIGALLRCFDLCLAQSTDDGARYAGLGAPRITTSGNLKLDVDAPPADAAKLAALSEAIGGRPVIAAASTHPGEEAEVIDAHRRLKHSFPGLLTLVAPRHPERGQGIADIAKVSGLTAMLRSRDQLPRASTDIYVADTMGELGLVYRLAPIVFMGGSLVSHGGQNPIEAIKLGAAVLHGPHVANFAEIYAALDAAGGAEQVTDSSKLAVRVGAWLKNAEARQAVADNGTKSLDMLAGALERTVAALEPYLMEFRFDRRADNA